MNITLSRETSDIYVAKSDAAFWQDGSPINERLAFDGDRLSSSQAQAIDRKNGIRYILPNPFSIKRATILNAARNLSVGQSVIIPC